jgi:hypothetical protein
MQCSVNVMQCECHAVWMPCSACTITQQPYFMLKNWTKQPLGSFLLAFVFPTLPLIKLPWYWPLYQNLWVISLPYHCSRDLRVYLYPTLNTLTLILTNEPPLLGYLCPTYPDIDQWTPTLRLSSCPTLNTLTLILTI